MKMLDLQQTASYLELADIQQTIDKKHALIHIGMNVAGIPFVLVNNFEGQTMLTEGM